MRALVIALAIVFASVAAWTAAGVAASIEPQTELSGQKKKVAKAKKLRIAVPEGGIIKGTRTPCISRLGRRSRTGTFNRIYGTCITR